MIFNLSASKLGLDDVQVQIVKVLVTRLNISNQRPLPELRHHAALGTVIVIDRMKALIGQPINFHLARADPIVRRQACEIFNQHNERGKEADSPA